MIEGGQLAAAVAVIAERNGNSNPADDVRVITLDIGGNDAFSVVPECAGGTILECQAAVGAMLNTFAANFGQITFALRQAAGSGATPGLNDIIRGNAVAFDAEVADMFGALDASDLQADCLHPNDSGHAKIADAFSAAIDNG